jgi:hypothetical protein
MHCVLLFLFFQKICSNGNIIFSNTFKNSNKKKLKSRSHGIKKKGINHEGKKKNSGQELSYGRSTNLKSIILTTQF